MIRYTPDTGFSDMVIDGSGPRYHYWKGEDNEKVLLEYLTLPKRGVEREYIPEFSEARRYVMLPSTTGLDAMSFEDQVSFIYSVNSFLGAGFWPIGKRDGVTTLVHSALDNRPYSYRDWYVDEALSRAKELFLKPENFSPESLSELRRIADKYRIFQKYQEYEYWMDWAGWKNKHEASGVLDTPAYPPHGTATAEIYAEEDYSWPYHIARRYTWPASPLSFKIKSFLLDLGATIADWAFIWFYDNYYRLSRFDRLSSMYYAEPESTKATTGGCGIQTTIEPMKEDPGNYVMDWDVYLLALGGVSEYSRILGLTFFSGNLPALSEWWYSGGILGDRSITGGAATVFCVLFFSLVVSVFISFRSGRSVMQYAAVLELVGLCAASLFAVVGLFWYDPIGQILGFIAVIISSCEFTILLAQSIRSSRRFGRPVFALLYMMMSLRPDDAELTVEDVAPQDMPPVVVPYTPWWSHITNFIVETASSAAGYTYNIISSTAVYTYNIPGRLVGGVLAAPAYIYSSILAAPAYIYSSILGAPAYIYSTVWLYGPGVISCGVPAFGTVLLLTAVWSNYDYAVKSRSPYPLYGERMGFGTTPKSNAGSDAVHEITADLSQVRRSFFSQLGDINTTNRNAALIDRYGGIAARGVDTSTQYGFVIPVLVTVLLLLVFIFALLLLIFSTRVRWADFKDAASQYECGSEQLHVRVTPLTASSFFRMLVVFLIFELEVVILFLAFPVVSLLNPASLIALTIFIFLIQIATILEVRSGAVRWLRSGYILPVLFSIDTRHLFETIYPAFSIALKIIVVVTLFTLCIADTRVGLWIGAVYLRIKEGLGRLVVSRGAVVLCVGFVVVPLLLAMPLKEPAVFYFLAGDLELDRKLAAAVLKIIDSPGWGRANLAGRKALWRPLMSGLLEAEHAGKVGFWCSYVELIFSAQSDTQLNGIWTLLRYHINANLSSIADFRKNIESKTNFCFTVASKPAAGKANFERCVQASMDIMYDKSVSVAGKPAIDFAGGIPEPLRQAWYRSFDECIAAKTPSSRARKCRMAAAIRSEFLFFSEAVEQKK